MALEEELEALEAARLCVQALESRGMSLDGLASVERLTVFFGKLSEENYKRLEESSQDVPLLVIKLGTWRQETWILAFTIPSYADEAEKLLNSVYFKRFFLTDVLRFVSGSDRPLERLEVRIENLKRAIDGLASAARAYLDKNRGELERLFSLIYTMQAI
jgi:V/A-type H+-transporting ATPase subunit I